MPTHSLIYQLIKENIQNQNPYLDLGCCGLTGVEAELELLSRCTHLKTLVFSNEWIRYETKKMQWSKYTSKNKNQKNRLSQIPPFLIAGLKEIVLAGDWDFKFRISDYSFLQNLSGLESLDLSYNQISDLTPLQNLSNLTSLNLHSNLILDIAPLQNLNNLSTLNLFCNEISDGSFLQNLTQLKNLNLGWNQIRNISWVRSLVHLKNLNLNYNEISDISPLQNLKNLERLDLNVNAVYDFSSLKKLTQLSKISLNEDICPPIWYVYLKNKGGKIGDYIHLSEPPEAKKIWLLIKSKDENNQILAQQLALSQAWSEDLIKMYQNL